MLRTVVIDLWGSATLRTGGEEIAQGLALMGCRPIRDHGSGRVTGVEGERALIERARTIWTGDKPNEVFKKLCLERGWPIIPAYIGLGFPLRGEAVGVNLYGSLRRAAATGKPHAMPEQRYDMRDGDGRFVERCWRMQNSPIFSRGGRST